LDKSRHNSKYLPKLVLWICVLHEKPAVAQPIMKFPAFYTNLKGIILQKSSPLSPFLSQMKLVPHTHFL
jgi:hypothetical protein